VGHLGSYFGSIAVGTPPVAYDVILDTGSADLFLVSSSCTSQTCTGVQTFDGSSSSTFNSTTTPFSITYGSGSASGVLGRDEVQMAGFQVSQQTFGMSLSITCPLHDSLTIFRIMQPAYIWLGIFTRVGYPGSRLASTRILRRKTFLAVLIRGRRLG